MTVDLPRVVSGGGELQRLGEHLQSLGAGAVLLITGPGRRFVDQAVAALGQRAVTVFDGAKVHVPRSVVTEAQLALDTSKAEAIVALGGGAAIGLGKALRLSNDIPLLAVPTTYAGSEMTRIWGITEAQDKTTGHDDRVRPQLVIHDPELSRSMPRAMTVQSLLNALAHPVSYLSRASATSDNWEPAMAAIGQLVAALTTLLTNPSHAGARTVALQGAAAAGRVLDAGGLGTHHTVAHVLGGRFGVPHAALHSILLPAFLADLRREKPERFDSIAKAAGVVDLVATLHDALRTVAAPTGLRQLELVWDDVEAALESRDIEAHTMAWVHDAFLGRRLAASTRQASWIDGAPAATLSGPPVGEARRVVVALHGRGSTADAIVQRVREITGDAPDVAIVAPQAAAARWYDSSYREAASTPELRSALEVTAAAIRRVREDASNDRIILFGFSQGACLALEAAARLDAPIGGVIALSGSRVGPAEWVDTSTHLRGVPMLLGLASEDPWATSADVVRSADHFRGLGAQVEELNTTGDCHEITGRQRLAARALLCEQPAPQSGFGNTFDVETLPGALPRQQNSPRHAPYGLTAEQINGTGFVAPRHDNFRSWLYRVRPAAGQRRFEPLPHATLSASFVRRAPDPNLAAFAPLPTPTTPTDFVDGLHTVGGAGDPSLRRGYAIHLYAANRSMEQRAFSNADGDLLLLPESGAITLLTELGSLVVRPGELAIVPRGFRFSVLLHDSHARGYIGEVFGRHFTLPERGPVGANGLVDARHFRAPVPHHEDRLAPGFRICTKIGGALWEHTQDHSPFDVAAWHGNYTPLAYDMANFAPMSGVRIDHADPSIYSVLTAPLDEPGSNALDLVVFPPRWDPTEGTFRPPFFHRNATMEFNGIIRDRHSGVGFVPGISFLTPPMTPHGSAASSVDKYLALSDASADAPRRTSDQALWFQFETALPMELTDWAADTPQRIDAWDEQWGVYTRHYTR
ncbi:MAG: homogentisate 1,2-dioxygenase [Nannocystaceae bacterium]|nr:homogentisate 1,2-dioxygenase [Nannocystaceae bacterium]